MTLMDVVAALIHILVYPIVVVLDILLHTDFVLQQWWIYTGLRGLKPLLLPASPWISPSCSMQLFLFTVTKEAEGRR